METFHADHFRTHEPRARATHQTSPATYYYYLLIAWGRPQLHTFIHSFAHWRLSRLRHIWIYICFAKSSYYNLSNFVLYCNRWKHAHVSPVSSTTNPHPRRPSHFSANVLKIAFGMRQLQLVCAHRSNLCYVSFCRRDRSGRHRARSSHSSTAYSRLYNCEWTTAASKWKIRYVKSARIMCCTRTMATMDQDVEAIDRTYFVVRTIPNNTFNIVEIKWHFIQRMMKACGSERARDILSSLPFFD